MRNITIDDDDPAVLYNFCGNNQGWNVKNFDQSNNGSYHYCDAGPSNATFQFKGTAIYYYSPSFFGKDKLISEPVVITLDNYPSQFVNLQGDDNTTQVSRVFWSSIGLAYTNHTITVAGGHWPNATNPDHYHASVDGFKYTVPDDNEIESLAKFEGFSFTQDPQSKFKTLSIGLAATLGVMTITIIFLAILLLVQRKKARQMDSHPNASGVHPFTPPTHPPNPEMIELLSSHQQNHPHPSTTTSSSVSYFDSSAAGRGHYPRKSSAGLRSSRPSMSDFGGSSSYTRQSSYNTDAPFDPIAVHGGGVAIPPISPPLPHGAAIVQPGLHHPQSMPSMKSSAGIGSLEPLPPSYSREDAASASVSGASSTISDKDKKGHLRMLTWDQENDAVGGSSRASFSG